jgi:hypothetical protein
VTWSRALPPALVALAVSVLPASAQMMGPMGGMGGSPFGGSPFQQQPQQPPPCVAEFLRLRGVVEKEGLAAKAAHDKQASREEMCKIITVFSAAEEKMTKYAETNATTCGIPAEAVKQMKGNHTHTAMVQKQICAAGPGPGGPPPPTLSDALGTNTTAPTASGNKGQFETLTGNALTR